MCVCVMYVFVYAFVDSYVSLYKRTYVYIHKGIYRKKNERAFVFFFMCVNVFEFYVYMGMRVCVCVWCSFMCIGVVCLCSSICIYIYIYIYVCVCAHNYTDKASINRPNQQCHVKFFNLKKIISIQLSTVFKLFAIYFLFSWFF